MRIVRKKSQKKSALIGLNYKKNRAITVPELRVIDDESGNLGVLTREEALAIAEERGVDLVLISEDQEIPVGKIIDWSKFKYSLSKKQKGQKAGSSKSKEWWFTPGISDYHVELKLQQILKFLKKSGGQVKVTLKHKNRATRETMETRMQRVIELLPENFEIIGERKVEGRNLCIFVKLK